MREGSAEKLFFLCAHLLRQLQSEALIRESPIHPSGKERDLNAVRSLSEFDPSRQKQAVPLFEVRHRPPTYEST